MASAAGSAEGAPITTSAVLMSASKHIASRCSVENRAFLDCKKNDPNPEKCLQQGQNVTRCVISLLVELNSKCPKAMESYTKCMDYYSNEFELCRKEQREFEASCPL
ncbi:NADH dehydrogenase [ubiquinone] 1 alpha subcomplex subunit 8-A [Physcomitrium patens]|uniref:CHCH domain-containing protein n=1 Tax=Physcomitrium patens TaxID=3218 RepID=A9TZ61_PHYPA|nr:NADH dehydrogenase [ubiquinone] 1 alpha subcomplex subunit 8-A-like [Physcomitrium patens]PNR46881.1 hypothetical protein PHYPA_014001 [Physcomitrium patens]|eukprot:XP_024385995.1 NADH dehydrogenase [ubiquinone] 1 alpha subcomplex subunit 8-A-like [Physcomitrella patens]